MSGARLGPRDLALLLVLALAILAPGLTSLPPVDRDESRYAVASTQMLASGDFIDIRYQDKPRYLQPVGIYWLQSISAATFTEPGARQIWAYRVPSLLGALAAVLLTGLIGAGLFGRNAGLGAAVLLAACFSLNFESRIAKTDAALLACITAAQFALLRIYLSPAGPAWRAAAFWAAVGAAMLIKGPIVLIVCGTTALALCLWDRDVRWLRGLRALWGVPLLLLVVLPWYVAIGVVSDWDFYARAIGANLLGKVGAGQQSHAGPPGYHLGLFTLAFWPSALFAALAVPYAWRNRREPGVRFLIAWIVPTWIVFELVATKLPHYVLPTYPALACLGAAAALSPPALRRRWAKGLGVAYALVWLAASALVALAAPVAIWQMDRKVSIPAIGLAVLVFALAVLTLALMARRRPARAMAAAALAALVAWTNTFALVMPRLENFWLTPKILKAVAAAAACPRPLVVTAPYHEPSLVFLNGPSNTYLADSPELAAGKLAQPGCKLAVIGAKERPAFEAAAGARGLALVEVGRVSGVNYSDGQDMELTLFAATSRLAR